MRPGQWIKQANPFYYVIQIQVMKKVIFLLFAICSVNGFAQSPFTFVFLHKKTDAVSLPKDESDKIMKGHMDNIGRLAKEGKLLAAGPFEGGGGIFIFKSNSIEEVKGWLATDPGVRAERWNVEILPYTPRLGSVCLVGEPYKMTMYNFIHYKPGIGKDLPNSAKAFKRHNDHIKKIIKNSKVITEGIFGDSNGGILVTEGDLAKEFIEKDPAILSGNFEVDFKQLWIAKGAFCEK
jgi:uncharacterized protein YciI